MSKTKKTQPVKASKATAKKATAKKTVRRKPAPKASDAPSGPDMTAFATLWQQKWAELLQEKGWPEHASMPSMGQMPFMFPFMMPSMASAPAPASPPPSAIDAATLQALIQRIAQLEHRIMELEHQLLQRNANKPSKTKR